MIEPDSIDNIIAVSIPDTFPDADFGNVQFEAVEREEAKQDVDANRENANWAGEAVVELAEQHDVLANKVDAFFKAWETLQSIKAAGQVDLEDRLSWLEEAVEVEGHNTGYSTHDVPFIEYDTGMIDYVYDNPNYYQYKRCCSVDIDTNTGALELYGMYNPHFVFSPHPTDDYFGTGENHYLVAARMLRPDPFGNQPSRRDLVWLNLREFNNVAYANEAGYSLYAYNVYAGGSVQYASYCGYAYDVDSTKVKHTWLDHSVDPSAPNAYTKRGEESHDYRFPILGRTFEDVAFQSIGYASTLKGESVFLTRIDLANLDLKGGFWKSDESFGVGPGSAFYEGNNMGVSVWGHRGGILTDASQMAADVGSAVHLFHEINS